MSDLSAPHFQNVDKAREHLEAIRWPSGPVCPHCGSVNNAYKTKRVGKYRCADKDCRSDFSVTVGTLFERSHIPLHIWFQATYLLCSSKKGISTHQLHRMLGVTYKTAWFMSHRIREAMRPFKYPSLMGRDGGTVEVDETFWGHRPKRRYIRKPRHKKILGHSHKEKILSLVERGGQVRSFHVERVNAKTLRPILRRQISTSAHVITDEAGQYRRLNEDFARHSTIVHSMDEYVRGDVHTNTIENYFSIMKRGLTGVYQHVGSHHLKRYLGEFDFLYNHRNLTDAERAVAALRGIEGKRLTYRGTNTAAPH